MRILFFDGYCNLCNNSIDWVIRHDGKNVMKFSSLQGETAKAQLPSAYRTDKGLDPDTVLYLRDGKVYERSRAVLHVLKDIGMPWALASVLLILPSFILDAGYRLIARYRYKVFGKKETCRIPTPEERQKILP